MGTRICTRFGRSDEKAEDGLPSHPGYPPAMILRILASRPLMLFSRPVGALPSGGGAIAIVYGNGITVMLMAHPVHFGGPARCNHTRMAAGN